MADDRRIARVSSSVLARELQGESVLLHLDSGEYFGLDETATRMWQLIKEKGDLAIVRDELLDEYDVAPETLTADLDQFVADLVEKHILEIEVTPR